MPTFRPVVNVPISNGSPPGPERRPLTAFHPPLASLSSDAAVAPPGSAGTEGVPPTDRLPATSRWQTPVLWFRRGAWAFADQTLFAFSNFLLNVALARLLTPQDYGTFTIGYTIFLFVGTIYTSLLIEPLLVFGAGIYRDDLRTYVRALVRFHWRSTGIASVLLLAAGAGMRLRGHPGLGTALFALAVANPCILLQWLMRRACYVRFEPRLAAYAGIWYVVALFVGGGILERAGWLSAATGILLMGVGSLVSALWITSRLDIRPFTAGRSTVLAGLVTEHWRYGRWVVASSVLGWVPQSLYYLLLPLHAGLEGTAALKALMNLVMPVLHAYQPMLVLMVPALVRARGTPAFGRTVRTMLLLSTLCSGVYWLLLGVLDRPLVAWLYKGQYVADASLLWIIGLLAITGAAVAVLGSALRALERSNHIFAAYAASTLVTVTVGVWLMMNWNVKGAAIGVTLSGFTTTATMAWCLWRARAQPATSAAAA